MSQDNNGWIKCSDKLPPLIGDRSKPVLVWCDNCGNMILGYGMSMMAGMFFVLPIGNHSRHHQQNNQRPQKCGLFLRRIYETI